MFFLPSFHQRLSGMPQWLITVYAAVCSFATYFCMYAFRKPFTAAGFQGQYFLHIDYKVWLVTAQVIGYMLSKFYGIRFISAMKGANRAATIVLLILIAWIALLFFALTPSPYNILFLFINGFPLGMVWGLVFSYLEGRKTTELMGAVLSVSFIFSSGVVKSLGKSLVVNRGVSEMWMPFFTGGLFVLPMILFAWLLHHVPPPTEEDVRLRSVRKPMTGHERKQFVSIFLPGIIVIVFTYVLLTILRDFRDNFANELWTELGYSSQPSIFTKTEIPVSLIVLFCMGLLILVKDNFKAFLINHYIIMAGYALALIATVLFTRQDIGAVAWMTLIGTGLYLSYVPFNALYFERMIASYRVTGNVGFMMYIADSFGYLGSVLVLFLKEFLGLQLSWTTFFVGAVFLVSSVGMVGTVVASIYYKRKFHSSSLPIKEVYAA
ncbi:DUF5690 family protein [Flavisolibacter nicotianae]|uniref:DUF5690 family protein n=1 Tax=Flavisolibacter nicotianae TaxID=2364882 RepID=UPI000EB05248|nr:DUF5690 family protein [Flavisolibacter nicotianae]